jgi:hypothetical protein
MAPGSFGRRGRGCVERTPIPDGGDPRIPRRKNPTEGEREGGLREAGPAEFLSGGKQARLLLASRVVVVVLEY